MSITSFPSKIKTLSWKPRLLLLSSSATHFKTVFSIKTASLSAPVAGAGPSAQRPRAESKVSRVGQPPLGPCLPPSERGMLGKTRIRTPVPAASGQMAPCTAPPTSPAHRQAGGAAQTHAGIAQEPGHARQVDRPRAAPVSRPQAKSRGFRTDHRRTDRALAILRLKKHLSQIPNASPQHLGVPLRHRVRRSLGASASPSTFPPGARVPGALKGPVPSRPSARPAPRGRAPHSPSSLMCSGQ